MAEAVSCTLCGASDTALLTTITARPGYETDFGIQDYQRQIFQCNHCTVYFNVQHHLKTDFYRGAYNDATYSQKLLDKYTAIRALPIENSDNKQRVKRIAAFYDAQNTPYEDVTVLDIGSGLCVFGGELKDAGFSCLCIDPDPRAIDHALQNAHVDGGHVGTLDDFISEQHFDLITFNKVLEHVPDAIIQLKKAVQWLKPNGAIYLELPDGEHAAQQGGIVAREEFYIEHFTIFTAHSLAYLVKNAGLRLGKWGAIHEPSDKYTLYAFALPR